MIEKKRYLKKRGKKTGVRTVMAIRVTINVI